MRINNLKTNHLTNPIGFHMDKPVLTWTVAESTGHKQESVQIKISTDISFTTLVLDSGRQRDISSLGYIADIELKHCTRYYWKVTVWADNGDMATSEIDWFETGKMDMPWKADWIKAPFEQDIHPIFYKRFSIPGNVKSARIYACGLGVYDIEVNGQKVGNEYLAPFYNDYNLWIQYQTYDITDLLKEGDNAIGVMLGNGWYKGRFGFVEDIDKLYGSEMKIIAEMNVTFDDGTAVIMGTDDGWLCHSSPVVESSIYDGEVYDANLQIDNWSQALCETSGFSQAIAAKAPETKVMERLSPPVVIKERWKQAQLIHTPSGEKVIDFGQIMTGWVEVDIDLPKDSKVSFQFGELLQGGNFFNDNLRTAKQEYIYISNGKPAHVRPHFTFYGFRFVKVEGLEKINLDDFTACIIYSNIDLTGKLTTSKEKVNRLIANAVWGQKDNFLDVPTDCPQRDERMGWTGDAQVFSATASFNMYTPAFYRKYLYDMLLEQRELDGSVPHVVPDVLTRIACITKNTDIVYHGSCAWGDAATVIPWNMYLFYGDNSMLESQFENMCGWVDYIKSVDENHGGHRLWQTGFHYGDWLALDNPEADSSFGGTENFYVASAYYYYSAVLTAKAAKVLGREKEYLSYSKLAKEVKAAIQKEYFTQTGRIAVPTQTAMVMALYMDFVPPEYKARLVRDLKKRLDDKNIHLDTGFVGTYYLCPTLSENGLGNYAYTLLLNEDFPSWLYEVNMGATTIWERWNSVLPNGLVSDTGMNSMNHYAYGAVLEWMYRYMCGINPVENCPGFKRVVIKPMPDSRFEYAVAEYNSASGLYKSGWEMTKEGTTYTIEIPFDCEAEFVLTQELGRIYINGKESAELMDKGSVVLKSGIYKIFNSK